MTRKHIQQPVWAWFCDDCGYQDGRIGLSSAFLPPAEHMRSEGWFIAEKWGDKCPRCATPPTDPDEKGGSHE